MSNASPQAALRVLDESALTELADEWEALLRRSFDNRFFLTPTWLRVWWTTFGTSSASILTVRDDAGELTGVLPLMVEQRAGTHVLTLLGDHNVTDYMDGLATKAEATHVLAALWSAALEHVAWDRVELHHVPASSPLTAALQKAAESLDVEITVSDEEVCPVAILCSSWDGYLQMLSKKQRHEIRRKLRRAQEGVEWSWRTVRTVEELERDLPVFFRLHELSAHDKARFMTEQMQDYFWAVTRTYLEAGMLRLSTFRREGVDIAATMSFVYRERYLLYNSGYDPEYSAHSPGIAAVALTMQDAIAESAVAFDFLSGDEPYKYQFGASNTYTCRVDGLRTS